MITFKNGKFTGKYDTSKNIKLWDILKWKISSFPFLTNTKNYKTFFKSVYDLKKLNQKEDFICWLSHASFFIQLKRKRILIDPVFGNIPFYKRYIPVPYKINELNSIDYLLISHVHYDHLDIETLHKLLPFNPHAILPKNMKNILCKIGNFNITELLWYETYYESKLKIILVPAKHWSQRTLFDRNKVLWGGYIIQSDETTIFFCGDSAMGEHFREIGKLFQIDYALMPIGSYKPTHIMKHCHLNPLQAIEATKLLGAKVMIPMHFGTFKLSDEPLYEPLEWLQTIAYKHNFKIKILQPGEVLTI